jgi:hypothetical protein
MPTIASGSNAYLPARLAASMVFAGSLRGAGDTRFPMYVTGPVILAVRVPTALLLGTVLGLGLAGDGHGSQRAWDHLFPALPQRAVEDGAGVEGRGCAVTPRGTREGVPSLCLFPHPFWIARNRCAIPGMRGFDRRRPGMLACER